MRDWFFVLIGLACAVMIVYSFHFSPREAPGWLGIAMFVIKDLLKEKDK